MRRARAKCSHPGGRSANGNKVKYELSQAHGVLKNATVKGLKRQKPHFYWENAIFLLATIL